jgi:predicted SnoaL-like aldol condensation-catalyzing enzyme
MSDHSIADKACQAMQAMFRPKAGQSIESYFSENLIQHDPYMRDGLAGLKEFVEEVAQSGRGDVTIYRTLVDGNLVAIHSKCDGFKDFSGPMIAFDIFRFDGGKIAEHWRGREPVAPANPSGRTQVDGSTEISERERTEENRAIVRHYRKTVMVDLQFDRIEEFIANNNYMQHASKVGDGIARLKGRIASVVKDGERLYLTPRMFVAEGNFVLVLTEGDLPEGPTALYDLFRLKDRMIVEHWDVLTPTPPRGQWRNTNSPF